MELDLSGVLFEGPSASSNLNLGKHRRALFTGPLLPPSAEEDTEGTQGPERIRPATSCVAWQVGGTKREDSPVDKLIYTVTEKGLDGDSQIPVCQRLDQHREIA